MPPQPQETSLFDLHFFMFVKLSIYLSLDQTFLRQQYSNHSSSLLFSVQSNPCHQLCGFPVVSISTLHPPTTHDTEGSGWRKAVAQGVKSPGRQPLFSVDVDVGSLAFSRGAVQLELGLIVMFVCNLYIFPPRHIAEETTSSVTPNPAKVRSQGEMKAELKGRLHCNMWSALLGQAKRFFFNWPCNLPQLGWITGENSSLERTWGDWHVAECGQGEQTGEEDLEVANQHEDIDKIELYWLSFSA